MLLLLDSRRCLARIDVHAEITHMGRTWNSLGIWNKSFFETNYLQDLIFVAIYGDFYIVYNLLLTWYGQRSLGHLYLRIKWIRHVAYVFEI